MPFLPVGLETASEAPGSAQTGAVPRLPEVSAAPPPLPPAHIPGLLSLLRTHPSLLFRLLLISILLLFFQSSSQKKCGKKNQLKNLAASFCSS